MPKTKIVATIGPASDDPEIISYMIESGVNIFRFNTKHSTVEWHKDRILRVQEIAKRLNTPVGILVDLQGPEIRIETPSKKPLPLKKDEKVCFATQEIKGNKTIIVKDHAVYASVNEGNLILINDGYNEFVVVGRTHNTIEARSMGDYMIEHRKGLNLPGVYLDLPSLTEQDEIYIDLARDISVDFFALSFVRSREDVLILKQKIQERDLTAHIIAKIEGHHAIENIDEIIEVSDAIMVARGDLGIELPIEQIAFWQKHIIKKCRVAARPVITATEMLQSMIENSRPTRAEVSDVANAVFDGTDAVMLSGESASGKNPVKSVQMLVKIAEYNEGKNFVPKLEVADVANQSRAITHAVMDIIDQHKDFDLDVGVIFTETGRTARDLSRFRPNIPIVAITEETDTFLQLTLVYGVVPHLMNLPRGEILEIDSVISLLKEERVLETGKRVIFVHGDHWKIPGLTNTITIKEIV